MIPLTFQPTLEVGRVGHMEALQQVAPIERQRLLGRLRIGAGQEGGDVTPERRGVQPDLVAAGDDHTLAELVPQEGEGIAEGTPRVRLVRLRPEQGQEAVAPVEALRGRDGEVGQQAESLGLGNQRIDPLGIAAPQLQCAEGSQLDHKTGRSSARPPIGHARRRPVYDWGTPPL